MSFYGMSLRILFAGTPDFALWHLEELLIHPDISWLGVLTQPDKRAGRGMSLQASPVKNLALKEDLWIRQPTSLNPPEIQETLSALQLDIIIVVAYGLLLPELILNIPTYGCINVHASLLPAWRGAAPVQRSILANEPITGITLMQMDKGLDTGDILFQDSLTIHPLDTTETLLQRLSKLGILGLNHLIHQLALGYELSRTVQQEEQATYALKIKKSEGLIQWDQPAQTIHCQIAAFNPWPIAWFELNDQRIRCWKSLVHSKSTTCMPGEVISIDKEGLYIACGNNTVLTLLDIQWPGKRVVSVADLVNNLNSPLTAGLKLSYPNKAS